MAEVPLQIVQLIIHVLFFRGAVNETATPGSSYFNGQTAAMIIGNLVIAFLSFILVSGLVTAALTREITDSYLVPARAP